MADRRAQRLALYALAFAAVLACDLLVHLRNGPSLVATVAATGTAGLLIGLVGGVRLPVVICVWTALLPIAIDRALVPILLSPRPAAAVVQSATLWPLCLLSLVGSRILDLVGRSAFRRHWSDPAGAPAIVAEQSLGAALALAIGLTLAVLDVVPEPDGAPLRASLLLVSALNGATIIHVAILFTVATLAVLLAGAFGLLFGDWQALAALRRLTRAPAPDRAAGLARLPDTRLVLEARVLAGQESDRRVLAQRQFREASRLFFRRILAFLPLLGFLGTVVGLSAAVADLPLGAGGAAAADVAASLRGLAIKFETTFLGLVGSVVLGTSLSLLERLEAEASAALVQIVAALKLAPGSD